MEETPSLERAGGADEVAEDGDVGAVDADATGIDGEAEAFGEVEIHSGIIEFGQTKTLRGRNAIESRRIHGAGRPVAAPGAASKFIKLPPIAFLPGAHTNLHAERLRFPFVIHSSPAALCTVYGWLRRLDAHPYQKVLRCHYQPFRKSRAERPVGGKPAAAQRQDTAKRKEQETFLA